MNCAICQTSIDYGLYARCLDCGKTTCGINCLRDHIFAVHPSAKPYREYEAGYRGTRLNAFACIAVVAVIGAVVLFLMFYPVGRL